MDLAVKHLVLQGNADARGFTISNLNLSGLSLTKNSVGLGNVDNVSDANKPVSSAMAAALALRELAITPGTTAQYWRGDKTWQTLGALALQGGNTTLQQLSSIGLNATSNSGVSAHRSDWASTFAESTIFQRGASEVGSTLGLAHAGAAGLQIINSTFAFIYTNNASPLIFGYNGLRRMRLMTGLNVGGDTDPGIGCIEAAAHIVSHGNISATGTILAGGTVGGGSAVITTTLTVGTAASVGTDLTVGDDLIVTDDALVSGDLTSAANVDFTGLPTSDPHVAGRLWRSTNDVKVSTG